MKNRYSFLQRSLAAKLILAGLSLILIGGGASWYALIQGEKKSLLQDAVTSAASYSDLVKKSLTYSMVTVNREAVQQTIDDIGSATGIRRIRIFDSKGKIFSSSRQGEIGQQVDRSSPSCRGCHSDPERPSETLADEQQWTTALGSEGYRLLTFIDPIYNDPPCYTTACHAHPRQQRVLGILETDFSLASVDRNIERQTRNITLYAMLLMGASGAILYFILQRMILRPVSTLSHALGSVSKGDLGQTVTTTSVDELGMLADAYNAMIRELGVARDRMERWTQTLEEEVAKKTEELKRSQDKLIQAEKLAALGRLTADVAHEIRNPLTALGGFTRRLHKLAAAGKEKEQAAIIIAEVGRLEKILHEVITFSRDARYHLGRHPVADIVADAAERYGDQCAEQSVRLEVDVDERLPQVLVDRDQVRQALANLIVNALDAMPEGGLLRLAAGSAILHDVPYVSISVSDTGQGIPEDELPLIFEPFFSTKQTGHGTGLGLSITRKIIEEHGGFIKAESALWKGSTFSLFFPQQSEDETKKTPCWEFMQCGRDKDASLKCPAYPHFGRICWVVAGTFCEGKVQGTFAQKCEDCRNCPFYQAVRGNNSYPAISDAGTGAGLRGRKTGSDAEGIGSTLFNTGRESSSAAP